MTKKAAINIFMDYVTGNLSTLDFWSLYKSDIELRNILILDKNRKKGIIKTKSENGVPIILRFNDKNFPFNPDNILQEINISRLDHRFELFTIVKRFLSMRGINIQERDYNDDAKEYLFLKNMLPYYIDLDISSLQKLFSEAPVDLTKSKKLVWCRNKLKEMFRFDNKAPNWYQEPQWPIVNGTPLIFSHQETVEEGVERYYFYDKNTKEQVIVEQID